MQNQHETHEKSKLNNDAESYTPFFEKQRKMSTWKGNSVEKLGDLLIDLSLDYKFKNDIPRLDDYSDLEQIKQKFNPLKNINNPDLDLKMYENSDFVFVFYHSFDDYHKSMKYGIFSLFNKESNDTLNNIYQQNVQKNIKTILVCFMENENHYIGLAELKGNYNADFEYGYWWNDNSMKGIFSIEWIFVKNIYYQKLKRFIDHPQAAIPGLLNSFEKNDGLYLLDHFKQVPYNYQDSIFYFFQLFDQREDFLHNTRVKTDFNISLKKKEHKPNNQFRHKRGRKNSNYYKKENQEERYEDQDYVYVKKS